MMAPTASTVRPPITAAIRAILGCTELSLIKRDEGLGAFYLDSMEVLARNAILAFGKTPIGFD